MLGENILRLGKEANLSQEALGDIVVKKVSDTEIVVNAIMKVLKVIGIAFIAFVIIIAIAALVIVLTASVPSL